MKARDVQVWLLSGARLACQANRLIISGLMPLMAADLGLATAQKGSLLAAFPLGYLMTQVLGGVASDRWGGKPVMALALASTGLGGMACGCVGGFGGLWWLMLLMGLLQGPSFPTNGALLSRWVPRDERASATAVTDAGGPVGALVALFCVPVLAAWLGWRLAMLACGSCTLAFTGLWGLYAANGPASCSYITKAEVQELQAAGVIDSGSKKAAGGHAFPWRIVLVPSVWSVLLGHSAFNYVRYLMYNWVVTFYTDALGLPVAEAASCMLWPNLADAAASVMVGKVADAVTNSGRMSRLATRRLFSTLGFLGTGAAALLLARVRHPFPATVLVTVAAAMQSCHNAGFKSSYSDLSREHSGLLAGLGNMLASASSFAVPIVAASLIESNGGSKEMSAWHAVFLSVFACSLGGAVSYAALVSTDSIDAKLTKSTGGKTE